MLTGGYAPSQNIIELAKEHGVTVIVTQHDSFTTSRLLVQSIPVGYVMVKENIVSFTTDDLVDDIKGIMTETRFRSYPVLDQNGRVVGTVSRYHLISNHKKKVIQGWPQWKRSICWWLEDAEILEIIDHHRVADIQTNNPIYFRNEPVGSTSTIVDKCFFENGIRPFKKGCWIIMWCYNFWYIIIQKSNLHSTRSIYLQKACWNCCINIEKFAKEMFKALVLH